MNYKVYKYKRQFAIFCNTSRCYVLFGSLREMIKRCNELNSGK
jgi:hypothetical protein